MGAKLYITPRYAETDQMGIIHHSVYPIWFEALRTEYIRQYKGYSYADIEKMGIMMPLTEVTCHYYLPTHYDEKVVVEGFIRKASPVKTIFDYKVYPVDEQGNKLSETPYTTGSTTHGWVDAKTFQIVNIKRTHEEFYEFLQKCQQEDANQL